MGRYTLLLICFLTISCGEALDTVGDAEPGPTTVPVEVQTPESGADFVINSATIENAVLSVVGSGTLPNGALISYKVKHDGFETVITTATVPDRSNLVVGLSRSKCR